MAVPASSDGRAADEGRSVLWRADFRHDHINGEACREGGGENAVFTGRCPASNEKHPAEGQGVSRLVLIGRGRVRPAVVTSANLCLFPKFAYPDIALSVAGEIPNRLCFRR